MTQDQEDKLARVVAIAIFSVIAFGVLSLLAVVFGVLWFISWSVFQWLT